jgi:iron complex transport system ATP-binding protein
MDLFRSLADQGRGVVLTLHDLSVAARAADRIVVLAEGRVIADGAPRDCLRPDILAAAYGVETRITDGVAGPLVEVVGRAR